MSEQTGNDKDTLVELLFQMSEILYAIEEAIHEKNEQKLRTMLVATLMFSLGILIGVMI